MKPLLGILTQQLYLFQYQKKTVAFGQVHEELQVPEEAIPAEEAAKIILEGVANKKGIIVFPELSCDLFWSEYCESSEDAESFLLNLAHERRIEWSKMQKM